MEECRNDKYFKYGELESRIRNLIHKVISYKLIRNLEIVVETK